MSREATERILLGLVRTALTDDDSRALLQIREELKNLWSFQDRIDFEDKQLAELKHGRALVVFETADGLRGIGPIERSVLYPKPGGQPAEFIERLCTDNDRHRRALDDGTSLPKIQTRRYRFRETIGGPHCRTHVYEEVLNP